MGLFRRTPLVYTVDLLCYGVVHRDLIVDLLNAVQIAKQCLQHLLEVVRWKSALKYEPPVAFIHTKELGTSAKQSALLKFAASCLNDLAPLVAEKAGGAVRAI